MTKPYKRKNTDKNDSAAKNEDLPSVQNDKNFKEQVVQYEFGGPIGAVGIIFGLPLVIYALFFLCNKNICMNNPLKFNWSGFLNSIPSLSDFFSFEAVYMYFAWMVFHIACERFLPGETVEGVLLDNNTKLKYTISGHLQFWICLLVISYAGINFIEATPNSGVYAISGFSPLKLDMIYDHYLQLISISIVGSFILSIYLYVTSFQKGALLAKGGNTGYMIYDFFIGRELNPRIGNLDLKEFCELRPGLIGWLVINLGMALKQYSKYGYITFSMLLLVLFQGVYVWDALYMEKAILTTMDITTDGFGYMLAFGDLSWVPFIYTLQARYLVDYDPNLSLAQICLFTFVHFFGFYIFRSSNSQKDSFRRDPSSKEVAHLKYLKTKRGTKLLISGWWGCARKINYTGDFLVTVSWCLLCGFDSPVPYFQAIYFLILLIHRAIRDDHMCEEKYGEDWHEYKKHVPYMFVPYII